MLPLLKYARVKKTAPAPAPVEEAPVEEAPVEEAPVEEAPVEEAPVPEWSMSNSKAELTAAAEAAGIEVRSNWTKAEILAALEG
tara:strand:+ start:2282 stop:2533 length:252 start_codon:yes stop_codon:yes gene_type:complete